MPSYKVEPNEKFKDDDTEFYIEIKSGKYEGACFTFGKIEFLGEDAEGNGKVSFDYNLLFSPEHVNLEEQKDDIETEIGVILHDIFQTMVKNEERNETRNNDIEPSPE